MTLQKRVKGKIQEKRRVEQAVGYNMTDCAYYPLKQNIPVKFINNNKLTELLDIIQDRYNIRIIFKGLSYIYKFEIDFVWGDMELMPLKKRKELIIKSEGILIGIKTFLNV